jgi:heme ABC exporter ATP-binding subunit CcmA
MTNLPVPLVVARDLARRFGHVVALRSVSLSVAPGEVVLLAGPNGAGKSTLLRVLAGLVRPTSGSVTIGGEQLRASPSARAAIGFLSHQTFLYDDLTARENLRFAARLQGLDSIETRVMDALNAAGLLQRAESRAAVLSHGSRQRLSIARATLHAPRVLLLDEPFSGLDAASVRRLSESMADGAAGGRALICVTHQPADIWQIATRVVLLQRGSVVLDTPRPELLGDFLAAAEQAVTA